MKSHPRITGRKDFLILKKRSQTLITNTKVGKMKSVHEKGLDHLITNTTGIPAGRPIMEGVLTSTKQGIPNKDVPELQKTHHKGKTQPKRTGQIPFAGPKY